MESLFRDTRTQKDWGLYAAILSMNSEKSNCFNWLYCALMHLLDLDPHDSIGPYASDAHFQQPERD